jgi:membrane associated rhomboid family serine protease
MASEPRNPNGVIPLKDESSTARAPLVTYALLAANAAAYMWELRVGVEVAAFRGGAIPYEILTLRDIEWRDVVAPPFTILTSMFLHGGPGHLGLNMLSLWIFGRGVEDALGRVRYLLFYVASGVAATLAQTVASAASGDVLVPMVGASGAIAGVLAGHLVAFPHARVLRYVPARLFIVGWLGLQVAAAVAGGAPGVAIFSHLGGFVAGFLLVRIVGLRPSRRARRSPP